MSKKQAEKTKVKRKGPGAPRGPRKPPPDALGRETAAAMAARGLTIRAAAELIGVAGCTLSEWLSDGVRTQYAITRLREAGFIQ